jgi:hypothetical protein
MLHERIFVFLSCFVVEGEFSSEIYVGLEFFGYHACTLHVHLHNIKYIIYLYLVWLAYEDETLFVNSSAAHLIYYCLQRLMKSEVLTMDGTSLVYRALNCMLNANELRDIPLLHFVLLS